MQTLTKGVEKEFVKFLVPFFKKVPFLTNIGRCLDFLRLRPVPLQFDFLIQPSNLKIQSLNHQIYFPIPQIQCCISISVSKI